MRRLLMRLDDFSEYLDIDKWKRMKELLDKYDIKPLFGIIPNNCDSNLLKYGRIDNFWEIAEKWTKDGWTPALHGYSHVFETRNGGINPVNKKSEFAGLSLQQQREKIKEGIRILKEHNIIPQYFFAPAHTFDTNTIEALRKESSIRIISDTIANDVYYSNGFWFVPQQAGHCRKLPFKTVTFCYHPNTMSDMDFEKLEVFLKKNSSKFGKFDETIKYKRNYNILDDIYRKMYFIRKK